jgi:glycosyltransferase involved in cell wall biosynthesis
VRERCPETEEEITTEYTDDTRTFSVVICTRNRARFLVEAIQSALDQQYPKDRYELLVVDNDSSDGTRALVEPYLASAAISVSYHHEPHLGVSHARNLGIAQSRHEYVAYLDDDIVAGPGWLAALDGAIRERGALALGGRIEPVLALGCEAPPWWSDANVRSLFGLDHSRHHPEERVAAIRWPLWLGTGNSAYAKQLLSKLGGFRTDFGPKGSQRRIAEDIYLNLELERAAVPLYYVHDASVKHRVTGDQLTRRSIWRRTYWAGVMHAIAVSMLGGRSAAGSLAPLVRSTLRLLVSREPARTVAGCRLAFGMGYLHRRWISARPHVARSADAVSHGPMDA